MRQEHLCERPGCTAVAGAKHKHCSRRCAALNRLLHGWRPEAVLLRPDVRKRACRNGAIARNAMVRKRRASAVKARLEPLLKHRVFQDLDAESRAAVLVLIGKGFRIGKAVGYQEGYHARPTPSLVRAQKAVEAA